MSRLISREEADGVTQSLVALNLCDVEQKAREAVDRARAEAKRLLTEAVARAREMGRVASARGEKAGFDAGHAKGLEAGRAEAFEAETRRIQGATADIREALIEMIGQIEAHRHEVIADAKQGLLHLAVSIAERICRARIDRSKEHLGPMIDEIIETTGKQPGLVLRVHPADAETIETYLGDLHGPLAAGEAAPVRLAADESIEPGGCVAERTIGTVDAQIETQISRLVSELMGCRKPAEPDAGEQA